jgi:hypothetical protein
MGLAPLPWSKKKKIVMQPSCGWRNDTMHRTLQEGISHCTLKEQVVCWTMLCHWHEVHSFFDTHGAFQRMSKPRKCSNILSCNVLTKFIFILFIASWLQPHHLFFSYTLKSLHTWIVWYSPCTAALFIVSVHLYSFAVFSHSPPFTGLHVTSSSSPLARHTTHP